MRYELRRFIPKTANNIHYVQMTERYAKLAKQHIARTSNTAREMWKLLEPISKKEAVG